MKAWIFFSTLFFAGTLVAQASGEENFRFRFAYRDPSQGGVAEMIQLQGELGSEGFFRAACGANGKLCACEFRNDANQVVEKTEPAAISYDERGNYFRCLFSGKGGPVTKIRVYNKKLSSNVLPLKSSLALHDLMGTSHDMNRVRFIYRYSCEYNFLQKEGTTMQSFDCSNQFQSCDPDGDPYKNFCLLKARFPFHLFADTYSTNFHQKASDHLYNGGGSGRLCGMQIKQYNCADLEGTPQKNFGLYAELVGYWDTSVQLVAAPDQSPSSYGFAARTSAATGECPPGLVKQIFYRAEIQTSDIAPGHNFTSGLLSTEIDTPYAAPSSFVISKVSGGHCDGSTCSKPQSYAGFVKTTTYSKAGQTEFCVIPRELLP